jgi:hypothetical protein
MGVFFSKINNKKSKLTYDFLEITLFFFLEVHQNSIFIGSLGMILIIIINKINYIKDISNDFP